MIPTITLQIGIPGGPELLIILLIAVLLFGANKLPKLARSSGQAMGEFQKGREEIDQELEKMREGASLEADSESGPMTGTSTSASETGPETSSAEETTTETGSVAETDTSTETETATES